MALPWSASKRLWSIPFAYHTPGRHRCRQPFEFDRAEVVALEQAADLAAGGGVDHHLIGPGEPLQAGGEVRRLADRGLLARIARADRLAYHHRSRCDADPDM